jgi:hypothetical protein
MEEIGADSIVKIATTKLTWFYNDECFWEEM